MEVWVVQEIEDDFEGNDPILGVFADENKTREYCERQIMMCGNNVRGAEYFRWVNNNRCIGYYSNPHWQEDVMGAKEFSLRDIYYNSYIVDEEASGEKGRPGG